jgi:ribosomal protein L37E
MYLTCRRCGNNTFRIAIGMRAECANCGEAFELVRPPEQPEPKKPQKYWFK